MAAIDYWLDNRRYRLDGNSGALYRGSERVKLSPVPLAILLHLVQHRERYVTVTEIGKTLGVRIEPVTYRGHRLTIVRALGRTRAGEEFIIAGPHGGYKFVADVIEVPQRDIEELGTVPRRVILIPQPAGEIFVYDDLTWYERERARLITVGNDLDDVHRGSTNTSHPRAVPIGTVWQTDVDQPSGKMRRIWTSIGTASFEGTSVCLLVSGPDINFLDLATLNYLCTSRDGKMHEIVRPNEGVFSWPLSVGKVWEARFSYTNYIDRRAISPVVSRYECTAYESISVPAGEFQAFKIEGTPVSREAVSRTAWYAPEPGVIVKRI